MPDCCLGTQVSLTVLPRSIDYGEAISKAFCQKYRRKQGMVGTALVDSSYFCFMYDPAKLQLALSPRRCYPTVEVCVQCAKCALLHGHASYDYTAFSVLIARRLVYTCAQGKPRLHCSQIRHLS